MTSVFLSLSVYFLTYLTTIDLLQAHPLKGKNVRDATSSDNLSFVVSLGRINRNGQHFCMGNLITRRSVLTCQHCIAGKNKSNIQITVGSIDLRFGRLYGVDSWLSFDQWNFRTLELEDSTDDDIAIIRLDRSVDDPMVKPVPIRYIHMMDYPYNLRLRMAGWGIDNDGKDPMILKTGLVELISTQDCIERGQNAIYDESFDITHQFFCSDADPWLLSSCGDSGGPTLNENNQLVALTTGICPGGLYAYGISEEFRDNNLMNNHLNLFRYKRFIETVAIL